jgi:hypothetical protein
VSVPVTEICFVMSKIADGEWWAHNGTAASRARTGINVRTTLLLTPFSFQGPPKRRT